MSEKLTPFSSSEYIESLEFTLATFNCLKRIGICTIGDLFNYCNNNDIHDIRGIGEKRYEEIIDKMNNCKVSDTLSIIGENSITVNKISKTENVYGKIDSISNSNEIKEKLKNTYIYERTLRETIHHQREIIRKQIQMRLLHLNVKISGDSLKNHLKSDISERLDCSEMYFKIIKDISITDELIFLLSNISSRNLSILVIRHSFSRVTLQVIAETFNITRERVRQIISKNEATIYNKVSKILSMNTGCPDIPLIRMQTALLYAQELGEDITYEKWSNHLIQSGLLGNSEIKNAERHSPLELFLSICNLLSKKHVCEFNIPENLKFAISLAADNKPKTPAKALMIIMDLSKEVKNQVHRHACFTGSVNLRWLSHEFNYSMNKTKDILNALGYKQINKDWFYYDRLRKRKTLNKRDTLEHTLRKMIQYCGPLDVGNLCSGLRHAVSRTRYPVPPPVVLQIILEKIGYSYEEGLWFWDGEIDEPLNQGEQLIFTCLKEKGSVVHHSELAQAFIESKLSFASLHATLKRTPLIERFDYALYKLRGLKVSPDEIERANNEGEKVPVNLDVVPKKTGIIDIFGSLGILPIGTGVFYSDNLPNLIGEWQCIVGDIKFDNLKVTKNEIKGLLEPFTYLECEVGDRVCISFNTWDRTISIEKIHNNEN